MLYEVSEWVSEICTMWRKKKANSSPGSTASSKTPSPRISDSAEELNLVGIPEEDDGGTLRICPYLSCHYHRLLLALQIVIASFGYVEKWVANYSSRAHIQSLHQLVRTVL